MEYRYITVANTYSKNQDIRTGYGIALVRGNDHVPSVLKSVSDLSADRILVEKLTAACNIHQLDPIHLEDVINDFLANM